MNNDSIFIQQDEDLVNLEDIFSKSYQTFKAKNDYLSHEDLTTLITREEQLTDTDTTMFPKKQISAEIRDQIKQEVSEALETEIKKKEEPESTISILQEHVTNYQK